MSKDIKGRYKDVFGRTYDEETWEYSDNKRHCSESSILKRGVRITINNLFNIEQFLAGGKEFSLNSSTRDRIIQEYGLKKEEGKRKGMYTTDDENAVFNILKEKFPSVENYKNYKALAYAVLYR